MSAPISGADSRALFTGDNADDDAAVVDSFFIETDAPPTPVIEAIPSIALSKPTPSTVLRTGAVVADTSYQPYIIINADPNRKELRIEGYSSASPVTFNDYVFLAMDPGLLTPQSAYRLRHGITINLDEHTGPIYFLPNSSITASFEVSWIAVTL